MLRFGPAGIPIECSGGTLEGIRCTKELGLEAMEMEFVRGVKMSQALAAECGAEAKKLDVKLSAHGPYAISLISEKKETAKASAERVLQTARVLDNAGGERVVFHSGYYGKWSKEESFKEMKKAFKEMIEKIESEGLKNIILAPETTGGMKEWGSLEELVALAEEFGLKRVWPTIDYAHIHCREGKPKLREKGDFLKIFDLMEKKLGKKAVENVHSHATDVFYREKGEVHHLPIGEGNINWKWLFEVIKENGLGGTIISESPLIEKDALKLKKMWETTK
ncbi:TIM barrel protein [Candidatus Micrarchaeota archaeon]|nr:TIM barrel protein [Candidatus Micrarchaeota archaeon]